MLLFFHKYKIIDSHFCCHLVSQLHYIPTQDVTLGYFVVAGADVAWNSKPISQIQLCPLQILRIHSFKTQQFVL